MGREREITEKVKGKFARAVKRAEKVKIKKDLARETEASSSVGKNGGRVRMAG